MDSKRTLEIHNKYTLKTTNWSETVTKINLRMSHTFVFFKQMEFYKDEDEDEEEEKKDRKENSNSSSSNNKNK